MSEIHGKGGGALSTALDDADERTRDGEWIVSIITKADEEIAPKYTFFRKYFEIGDEEIKIHKK